MSTSTGIGRTRALTFTPPKGTPMPDRVFESIRNTKTAIKGPITTPVGSGFRSVNVALPRNSTHTTASTESKAYEGVKTHFPESDLVIIGESHEVLYATSV